MSGSARAVVRQSVDEALRQADHELQQLVAAAGLDEAALAGALARARALGGDAAAPDGTGPTLERGAVTDLGAAFRDGLRRARLALVQQHAAPRPAAPAPIAARSTDPMAAGLAQAAQKVTRVQSGEAVASGFDLSDASAAAGVPHPTVEGSPEEVFADTGEFRNVAAATAAAAAAATAAPPRLTTEPPPPTLVDALSEDTDLNGFELDETIEPDGFDEPRAADRGPASTSATPTSAARAARSLDEVLGRGRAPTGPQTPPGPTPAAASPRRAPAGGAAPASRAPTPPPTRTKSGLLRRIFGKEPKDD
ncbi:MAG: hypothetical protein IPG96_07250 [Proteobacteria bacterium]|nr:hypothetical protein [Pseudomonadota bacterium]